MASVGCSVFAYDYLAVDFVESPHGRAPAVATGVRRVRPDAFVFTYQGDGDLAAIGTAEIVHAAARGERISVDLRQQRHLRHDRRPDGADDAARPADDLEPDADARHASPATRSRSPRCSPCCPASPTRRAASIADPPSIGRAKAMLRRAFELQLAGDGFSIVEILSTCPVGWGMTPSESMEHLAHDVVETYPLGVIVDRREGCRRRAAVRG